MTAVTQFDVGPLSWVKNEIDLALGRADQALANYTASVVAGSGELTQLKFCRTHLHQVQGALTIVGLDGVTQFTEAVEALLDSIEQQLLPAGPESIALVQRALATIGDYLDDLLGGQPNQPLRLLPIYREVQAARRIERVAASDLFFPDLTVRPPPRQTLAPSMTRAELQGVLRRERSRFQRGFLSWLRSSKESGGIGEMQDAVRRIEEIQEAPSARSFWWVAGAFLGALAEGALPPDVNAKQLCARIDLQIRRLLEGSRNVAERLLRDALYLLSGADGRCAAAQAVSAAYRLPELIPAAAELAPAPRESVRRKLRELVAATEESWSRYCAGTVQALPLFAENAAALSAIVDELGHTDFRRLAQAIAAVGHWLGDDSRRHSDALAMEIATAILLAQNAQENFRHLGGDFAHQVDVTVARIHGCLAGSSPLPGSEIPLLDEMSREAQEKLLVGQVAREIQSNLGQIEQVLDGFFRDVGKRAELASLDVPLRQVAGALSMMHHDGAVAAVRQCAQQIKHFSDPAYDPQDDDFERVANQLSLIGFFIDTLSSGGRDFEAFVRQMQPAPVVEDVDAPIDAPGATLEQELARQKQQTHALLGALKEQPDHQGLRDEIRSNLSALRNEADLVADRALGEQTKAMLSLLASGEDASPQIDQVMAALKSPAEGTPKPSAETVELAKSSSETIDAELLGIFLEEAREVLSTIDESLVMLRQQPHKLELLTTIRRSFHTLKGSGRMVGLKDLGEAAWAVEQTLNLWLRQELDIGAPILDLLTQAHALFAAWVRHLESPSGQAPDAGPLIALAESLRSGREDELAPDLAGQTLPSARIIAFPPPLPAIGDGDYSVDLEAIEIADVYSGGDSAPADFAEPPAGDDSLHEAEGKLRISISPVLYGIFSEEARAHLATLQAHLLVLEKDPATMTASEMYRAAHTLAGISATVGIDSLNRLALELERSLLRRDNSAQPSSLEALATLRQAVDAVALTLSALAAKQDPEERPELIDALEAIFPASLGVAVERPLAPDQAPAAGPLLPLTDEIDEQLLPIFLEEALELSQGISTELRSWRHAPSNGQCVRTIERLLHTLKGSARMAGAMNLGEIAHAIETRVEQARCAGDAAPELIDEIDTAFDSVLHIIERLHAGESLAQSAAAAPPAQVSDVDASEVVVERRFAGERGGENAGEGDSSAQHATLRVRADLIDRLANEAGELSIARARIEGEMRGLKGSLLDLTENVIRLRRQLREIEIQAESQMQSRSVQADEQHVGFDPLEFDRFTRFQELTRMMAESVNDVATVQQSLLKNVDDANAAILAQSRLNRDLQQQLMAVRMVPFGNLADRLYRTVRQTSKELGKRANLEISGGQVELDRNVLDKISAPLEHLLRNAIAHGLEERELRIAAGKPAIGELALALKQEGNEIILTLRDDGAGLDFVRIRQRAIAVGLLAADDPADSARLAELIFTSGFSTVSEVSQVAGRGIGMDVVKTEITRLGGRIEVLSTVGQGTEFRLFIPLTLALTKALLVRAGNRDYAIPSVMIEQVLDLKEKALTRIRVAGSAQWMGRDYPFNYLPHLLGETQALPEARRQYWVLLLSSATRRIAVQVDELMGNEEIVVKNIGPQLARVIGVDGATVLANGQVVLILNPVALSTRAPLGEFAVPLPTAPSVPRRADGEAVNASLPTVMVVDDSLTVRKITGRLLSREGYQVMTAKDGVDALEQLLDVVPEVMLVDIEMPRMDGFDLTRNIRADARLKDVPIIMITSRIAEKHRAYAFEIGVNDYLGKPYQEDELLRLVASYVTSRRPLS
jgi:chemosensory pili system protein ChpA (sensor histidine kinase/response regulator)